MTSSIDDLVRDLEPVPAHPVRRLALRWVLPALAASGLLIALWIGARPDMPAALALPSFWVKLLSMTVLACLGWAAFTAAARPGGIPRRSLIPGAILIAVVLMLGALNLAFAEPASRLRVLMGQSWQQCFALVVTAALPVFAASIMVMRAMAPTRLRIAGFAAGLFAGAAGASVYSFGCTETSMTFLAVWYQGAILTVAMLGALAGPRLLRW